MRKVVYRGSNNDYDHHFAYQAKPLDYLFTGEPQSKYPVLHYRAFGGTGFMFLGRLGSPASALKSWGPILSNFRGRFFHAFGVKNFKKNFCKAIASA